MVDIKEYIKLASDNIDNAEQYRLNNSPKNIYRYMPLYDRGNPIVNKRNIDTITENKVWASTYSSLNDPFEFNGICLDEDKM